VRTLLLLVWLIVTQALPCVPARSEPRVGRLDLLANVHGYDTGKGVVVPLRGIAEWLGAQVHYHAGKVEITLGDRDVSLTTGSSTGEVNGHAVSLTQPATVFGGITCVPIRFIADSLGATVEYDGTHKYTNPFLQPYVTVRYGGRQATVLVHQEPPDAVGRIVNDLENTVQRDAVSGVSQALGGYGVDWVLEVTRIRDGYFIAGYPAEWVTTPDPEIHGGLHGSFFFTDDHAVYGYRDGRWRVLMATGPDAPSRQTWPRAGIPLSVPRAFGLNLDR
jgi:hypothetical protein